MKTQKSKNLFQSCLALVACALMTIVVSGCNDGYDPGDEFVANTQSVNFVLTDGADNPVAGAYVAVMEGGAAQAGNFTAFTDQAGNDCTDPDSDEPSVSNFGATQAGCTDANGEVTLLIDTRSGGLNCYHAAPLPIAGLVQVSLFIKTDTDEAIVDVPCMDLTEFDPISIQFEGVIE